MEDEAIGLAIHCGCIGMEGECGEAESVGEQDGFGKMHEESVLAEVNLNTDRGTDPAKPKNRQRRGFWPSARMTGNSKCGDSSLRSE